MRFRRVLSAGVLVVTAAVFGQIGTGVATADPTAVPLCAPDEAVTGTALSGSYGNLTVTGSAYVAGDATVVVNGNLTVAAGACLDAFSTGTVHVTGNILVKPGATLALGCAPGANGPPPLPPCGFTTTDDTVGGNITASRPLTMYLTAVTVGGNVTSNGGGPGLQDPATSFPVKNMTIGGNLVLNGWTGAWIGALRNSVGGNLIMNNNVGARTDEQGQPDSTEVVANSVGRNLICQNNTPTARFGDAVFSNPAPQNVVGHRAIGECASLVG